MNNVMKAIDGNKTYITATAGAVTIGLWFSGFLDDTTASGILGLLGFGSVAALRHGVQKSTNAANGVNQ